jgi:peptidoglycan hydrolase-like protein with peptidoglycan-binding domain
MTAPFVAGKHPRAAGGLFAATAASQTAHPAGAWAAGPIKRGTGSKGKPDSRVRALQQKLNALGIHDAQGHTLRVDGIDGAHTTAAIKAFQSSHGMTPTGVVDAKTMVAILNAKPQPSRQHARSRMRGKSSAHRGAAPAKPPATYTPSVTPSSRSWMEHGRGLSRGGAAGST